MDAIGKPDKKFAVSEATPTGVPMCPMAATCKSMMDKPFAGVALATRYPLRESDCVAKAG
jgi:hypothetical protein